MAGGINRGRTTSVALVSPNHLLRFGLQKLVETEKWIHLINHPATSVNIEEMLTEEQPHIVIVDRDIESEVPELIRRIRSTAPRMKIILLSGFDHTECTRQAIGVGIDAIVLKVQPSAVLVATIAHLACPTGDRARPKGDEAPQVDMNQALDVPALMTKNSNQPKWAGVLTEREREVIRLVSQGLSNKDIADRLCISSITVRHHLTNIFDKVGVSNRQKLLIRAHQYGLVGPMASA